MKWGIWIPSISSWLRDPPYDTVNPCLYPTRRAALADIRECVHKGAQGDYEPKKYKYRKEEWETED